MSAYGIDQLIDSGDDISVFLGVDSYLGRRKHLTYNMGSIIYQAHSGKEICLASLENML